MTFQITREECNMLIRAYQEQAANNSYLPGHVDTFKSELEQMRNRIALLAQHAAFLGGRSVRKESAGPDSIPSVSAASAQKELGDECRKETFSLFKRKISPRVLQGVPMCTRCMQQKANCNCGDKDG